MDNRLPYDNSLMNLQHSSSLLSNPLFHLENQRQISLRHLQRLKRLQAEEYSSQLVSPEEHGQTVRMAAARLEKDLDVLATQLDELRLASTTQRADWRWFLPLLCVPILVCRFQVLTDSPYLVRYQ